MRDKVLMDLVDRAMSDREFRARASEDLEGTLSEYGYELTPEEMEAVKEFHSQSAGMSDEELDRTIAETSRGSRQQGG